MRITILAVGSRGDVQPYVALGAGLRDAGHRVRLGTHEPFRHLVAAHGLEFAKVGDDPRALLETQAAAAWLESAGNPIAFLWRMDRLARPRGLELANDALAACGDADAIVSSPLAAAGYHIAEARGVPNVPALLQPLNPTSAHPSVLVAAPSLGRIGNRLSHHAAALAFELPFRRLVNAWRRDALGLPPVRGLHVYRRLARQRRPVLYGYSPSVVPKPADWGDELHVTGYWMLNRGRGWRPPARLAAFLDAGPPPVFAGFGSMRPRDPHAFGRVVLDGLRRAGRRVLVGAGWAGLTAEPTDEVLVVGDVPHDWLFPRCAAVVHHGGAGTTAAALRAGVPSLAVPFFADQFFWGHRIAALAAGPRPLPARRLTADRLAAAASAALHDPVARRRAAALGVTLRAEDGVGRAVDAFTDAVERLKARRQAPIRQPRRPR